MANMLLVDDDRVMRMLLREALHNHGYNMHFASSAEEGWDMMMKNTTKVDALLLDRELSGMSGIDLVEKMKAEPTLSFIPVIMLSGSGKPEEIQQGIDAGVHYYLVKPMENTLLRSVIGAALRESQQKKAKFESTAPAAMLPFIGCAGDYGIDENAFIAAQEILGNKLSTILICYMEDAERHIERIAESVVRQDVKSAIAPAHMLKSSSRQLGFKTLADLAARAEISAKKLSGEEITAILPEMRASLSQARPFFERAGK